MIDLHCHILPGIDDGAKELAVSLDMAYAFAEDGVQVVACTPHILPGLYHNTGHDIRNLTALVQREIDAAGIPLRLVVGADIHMTPDLVRGLRSGTLLSLCDSRYVLIEPPHHVAPPRLEETFFDLLVAGFVPILTHPERLSWIEAQYDVIKRLVHGGVWMQITAGSLAGAFGHGPRYWSERMLDEGMVHIIATDAHDTARRPPILSLGRDLAARCLGEDKARHLVYNCPLGVIRNEPPSSLSAPPSKHLSRGGEDGRGRSRKP